MSDDTQNFFSIWREFKQFIFFTLIGGMGGIVYLIVSTKRLQWTDFLKAFFVAAFSGFIGGTLCDYFGVDPKMQYVGAGLSGFMGGFGILWFLVFACKRLGMDLKTAIQDVQSLRAAMERHAGGDANAGTCSGRELLEALLHENRITRQEFAALFCGDSAMLEALLAALRVSPAEYEILKATDFLNAKACGDEQGKE